jgi:hypothetical protein
MNSISTLLTKLYDLGSGFADLDTARIWVRNFIVWYNYEHRRIRFVIPAQRHRGEDHGATSETSCPL